MQRRNAEQYALDRANTSIYQVGITTYGHPVTKAEARLLTWSMLECSHARSW